MEEEKNKQQISEEIGQKIRSVIEAIREGKIFESRYVYKVREAYTDGLFREVAGRELGVNWELPKTLPPRNIMYSLSEGNAGEVTTTVYPTNVTEITLTHTKFNPDFESYEPEESYCIEPAQLIRTAK